MAKNLLTDKENRNPLKREVIKPVDVNSNNVVNEKKKTDNKSNRTSTPNERTDKPNGSIEFMKEISTPIEDNKRETQRYSFEAYKDQIELINDIQYKYKKKTGKKIATSKIIRDILDANLESLLKSLR